MRSRLRHAGTATSSGAPGGLPLGAGRRTGTAASSPLVGPRLVACTTGRQRRQAGDRPSGNEFTGAGRPTFAGRRTNQEPRYSRRLGTAPGEGSLRNRV